MGKNFDLDKPRSGDYFTGEDVNPTVLPDTPKKDLPPPPRIQNPKGLSPTQKAMWEKHANRIPTGKGTISRISQPPPSKPPENPNQYGDKSTTNESNGNGGGGSNGISPLLGFFLSRNLKRAEGNPASVWTIRITTEKNGKQIKKPQDFHLIICWYQFIIGALGGIAVGVETQFFSWHRFQDPNVPVPYRMNNMRRLTKFTIQTSSSFYRVCKRAVIAGYLFDVIDKNIEEYRNKQDWKNMGISGLITGGLFGCRGGYRGSVAGSLLFGGFASIAGFQYYKMKKPSQSK